MKLFLYGAGGAALEVYDMIMRNISIKNRYTEVIFIDDFQAETEFYGTRRIKFSSCEKYMTGEASEFAVAVGEPYVRLQLREKISKAGYKLATLIDEKAVVSPSATIGEGSIINYGAIVSSNAVLSTNVFVMFGAIIGHEAEIGKDVTICPKTTVGAHCHIGEQTFVGIGSSVIQGVDVGKRAIIGMGSVVFRKVEENTTVLGNPARVTKGNENRKVF